LALLHYRGRILFSTLIVSGPYLCPYLSDLAGIQEGTAASAAYLEAMVCLAAFFSD